MPKKYRQKKCKASTCGKMFTPARFGQVTCDYRCAIQYTKDKKEVKAKRDLRKARQDFKLRDKKHQRYLAQAAFNKFIRLRDQGKPCISCRRLNPGQIQAGHYRTTAAAPQLRFCEDNVHAQCAQCNHMKSGNIGEYRIELVRRIGIERVEWLEGNHELRKYSLEDYIGIKETYQKKCLEIISGQNQNGG